MIQRVKMDKVAKTNKLDKIRKNRYPITLQEKCLLTKHHLVSLRLKQEKCISKRLWCHFFNFPQWGKTIRCIQVHDILWNYRIMEEKEKLFSSKYLPKSPSEGGVSSGRSSSLVLKTVHLCNCQ